MTNSNYSYIYDKYKEKIRERIALLKTEFNDFCNATDIVKGSLQLPIELLNEVVLNYFVDIDRLKEFHTIDRINNIKIAAYLTYWWVKIKPIQIINYPGNNSWRYLKINESFASTIAISIVFKTNVRFVTDDLAQLNKFYDFLHYCLKYRNLSAQGIELAFMGLTTNPINPIQEIKT
jgi:hypothetical protein